MNLNEWALKWRISPNALAELHVALGLDHDPDAQQVESSKPMSSEASVVAAARLQASSSGGRLWRNNNGAGHIDGGQYIRWGLCNDSRELNAVIKSSDLIGIRPQIVTPEMVGTMVGRFWAIECKEPGWRYSGTEREQAQLRFIALVNRMGGVGSFWNGLGAL